MIKLAWQVAAGVGCFVVGVWLGISVQAEPVSKHGVPYCSAEDSCIVDYRDGRWHVEPTVP